MIEAVASCTPYDPRIALVLSSAAAVAAARLRSRRPRTRASARQAASLNRANTALKDRRGFTLGEVTLIALAIALLLAAIYALTIRCYRIGVPLDTVPIDLRANAILVSAPPPAGTRAPRCETGAYCRSPGSWCGRDKECTDTYEWDTRVSEWRCGCECR